MPQEITNRQDVYTRITNQIIEQLEKGIRPWVKPWNAEHAAGRITRPLRHNGQAYSDINILSLRMSAELQGNAAYYAKAKPGLIPLAGDVVQLVRTLPSNTPMKFLFSFWFIFSSWNTDTA
jgi:N-terminal domain of anti-restriction factor ArdC